MAITNGLTAWRVGREFPNQFPPYYQCVLDRDTGLLHFQAIDENVTTPVDFFVVDSLGAVTIPIPIVEITENNLNFSDITTANASADKHGLLPKLDGNALHFLNGAGDFVAVTGSGTGDVVGPAGATSGHIATYDGSTGKLIEDGGASITDVVSASVAAAESAILPIDLAADVTGLLPYTNIQNVSVTDRVLGRSSSGAGVIEEIVCTAFARTILDDVNAAAVRATIGAGTGDGTVTNVSGTPPIASSGGAAPAISLNDAGVTYAKIQDVSATDKVLGRSSSGSGVVEEIACTGAGRALIDDADAAAQRTTLGLGTLATQSGTFVAVDAQAYTTHVGSPFTYSLPANVKTVLVGCYAAGGGGAGGGAAAGGTAKSGGGGGGGGAYVWRQFKATDIGTPGSATVSVTVGTGGTHGSGAASAPAAGADGSVGGNSSFGAFLVAYGGGGGLKGQNGTGVRGGGTGGGSGGVGLVGGAAANVLGGLPAQTAGATPGISGQGAGSGSAVGGGGQPAEYGGGSGGNVSTAASSVGGTSLFGAGGGGAGGYNPSNTTEAGGAGGSTNVWTAAGGGEANGGTAGSNNAAAGSTGHSGRGGGGGGGGSSNANPGKAGGVPGGGGGGGGAGLTTGGDGGDGGDGSVYVFAW